MACWCSFQAMAQLPERDTLYRTIVTLDSVYFTAYNTCDLQTQANLFAEDIEFYHDSGGLMTSKQELLAGIQEHICGKVSRELIPGSIEVHAIPGWGAIEMGLHQFHNKEEPETVPHPSRFIIFWQQTANGWQMTKVVSLH